jgi:PAS domain S-box-containing protein
VTNTLPAERIEVLEKAAEILPGVLYQYRVTADGAASVTYVSEGCKTLWELTPEEAMTNIAAIYALVHPEDLDDFARSIQEAVARVSEWRHLHRIITASGAMKWVQGMSRPERMPNGDILFSGVLLDVTEHREAEVRLQGLVKRLSTPMISVWDGVLVLPLIGDLDRQRIDGMVAELLPRVARDAISSVILDLTGIAHFDEPTAEGLLGGIRAVGLLGGEAVLTGIAPPVAQAIVALGVDLGGIRTYATVAQALERVLAR